MKELQRSLLKKRILYILYNIGLLAFSFILGKFVQMLVFILFYDLIQNSFLYRFHADTIFPDEPLKASKYCKLITIGVELLYLILCKDLNVSIYSNLFLIFLITGISALLQYYFVRYFENKNILTNKKLLEEECKKAGLSSNATKRLVMHYIEHKSLQELANLERVEIETIKQSIRRSRKRLGLNRV